jgi:hypothetical protein
VTRLIVYEHDGDKDGVFVACVRRAREEFEQEMSAAVSRASSHDLETIVEPGGDVYFGLLERNPRRGALLLSSTTALSGDLSDRLTELGFATWIASPLSPNCSPLRLRTRRSTPSPTRSPASVWDRPPHHRSTRGPGT